VELSESVAQVLTQIRDSGINYLDLQFTDIIGLVKSVRIPARQVETALKHGIWFDGSAIEGFARVAESDMYLRPDLETFAILPWESGRLGRLVCDVYTPAGEPSPSDPRGVLRRALEHAAKLGYRYLVAPELEFFLLTQPQNIESLQAADRLSYFDSGATHEVVTQMTDALDSMGIHVDAGHHEVGGGQYELDFEPLDALSMADAIMTARLTVKTIAQKNGMFATFMPKPIAGVAGSGMHVHQMLMDFRTDTNSFANSESDLSPSGRSFVAGQLAHARAMCAVLAPLVNSYKRLVSGLEAPVDVTWAHLNRSALIRVPRINADEARAMRIELRCVDPSCNPYLALAVMLRAGLDGIEKRLELPDPAEEELYSYHSRRRMLTMLPTSLYEALGAMEDSDLVSSALGLNTFERFLEAKRIEWNEYALQISPWELSRYLAHY
jgi:glutamine synthetase